MRQETRRITRAGARAWFGNSQRHRPDGDCGQARPRGATGSGDVCDGEGRACSRPSLTAADAMPTPVPDAIEDPATVLVEDVAAYLSIDNELRPH